LRRLEQIDDVGAVLALTAAGYWPGSATPLSGARAQERPTAFE
jgi:hypothetical protein